MEPLRSEVPERKQETDNTPVTPRLTLADLLRPPVERAPFPSPKPDVKPERLNTRDESMNSERDSRFAAALKDFPYLDLNEDGKLSVQELKGTIGSSKLTYGDNLCLQGLARTLADRAVLDGQVIGSHAEPHTGLRLIGKIVMPYTTERTVPTHGYLRTSLESHVNQHENAIRQQLTGFVQRNFAELDKNSDNLVSEDELWFAKREVQPVKLTPPTQPKTAGDLLNMDTPSQAARKAEMKTQQLTREAELFVRDARRAYHRMENYGHKQDGSWFISKEDLDKSAKK